MGKAEDELLKAIGVNPAAARSSNVVLPLNMAEIQRLLKEGVKPDAARDRLGSTALGIAAFLGRTEAMKLLMEYGAVIDAENLDSVTPMGLAVFGRKPASVAMLLVYGGSEFEHTEALNDARATGAKDVIAVFEAWEEEEDHALIAQAEAMYENSEPILKAAKAAKQAAVRTSGAAASSEPDLERRLEAAEYRAAEAESRAAAAEERANLMEARALKAEAALAATEKKHEHHGFFSRHAPHLGHHGHHGHNGHHGHDTHTGGAHSGGSQRNLLRMGTMSRMTGRRRSSSSLDHGGSSTNLLGPPSSARGKRLSDAGVNGGHHHKHKGLLAQMGSAADLILHPHGHHHGHGHGHGHGHASIGDTELHSRSHSPDLAA